MNDHRRPGEEIEEISESGEVVGMASRKAGMDEKTARKYRDLDKMPSEIKVERHRDWRTRPDPFAEVWAKAESFLENNEGLEAKTLFAHLQREHPVKFADGQLRTFQRRVKVWRATEGPSREVCFPQEHAPGRLSQSDFTHMALDARYSDVKNVPLLP